MKILSYIVSFIVGAIILLPPVDINYLIALSPQVWICCILAVALLAGYLFFLDINPFLKALVVNMQTWTCEIKMQGLWNILCMHQ